LAQRAGENVSLVVTTSKGEIHRHEKFWYFFQKAQQYFTADFVERSQANGMSLEMVVGDEFSLGEVMVNGEPTAYVADLLRPSKTPAQRCGRPHLQSLPVWLLASQLLDWLSSSDKNMEEPIDCAQGAGPENRFSGTGAARSLSDVELLLTEQIIRLRSTSPASRGE
jgi:hypothetical protein